MNFIALFWILFISSSSSATTKYENDIKIVLSDYWKNAPESFKKDAVYVIPDGKIPRYQLEASWGIHFPLFFLVVNMNRDNILAKFSDFFCYYSLFVCIPMYFGYWPSFKISYKSIDSYFPSIELKKMNYDPKDDFITRQRWLAGPLFWLSEILILLPTEIYTHLRSEYCKFFEREFVAIMFFVFAFEFFGIYEMIEILISKKLSDYFSKKS